MPTLTKPLKNLSITPSAGSAFQVETPRDLIKLHQCCVIVGKRGSGKSTSLVSLVEKLPFDILIAVSPTMRSNHALMSRLNIHHVLEDPDDPGVVDKVREIVEAEAAALDDYRDKLKRFKAVTRGRSPLVNDDDLLAFWDGAGFKPPTHKYRGKNPTIGVIFDDVQGGQVFSKPRKLNQLVIFHRHLGQLKAGGALGVSLFFLIQSFKSSVGGLPKTVRNQMTSLILFKTQNELELNEIAEEVSGEVSKSTFMAVYKIATADPHSFLLVDLHPKPNHASAFRKNLDRFILP